MHFGDQEAVSQPAKYFEWPSQSGFELNQLSLQLTGRIYICFQNTSETGHSSLKVNIVYYDWQSPGSLVEAEAGTEPGTFGMQSRCLPPSQMQYQWEFLDAHSHHGISNGRPQSSSLVHQTRVCLLSINQQELRLLIYNTNAEVKADKPLSCLHYPLMKLTGWREGEVRSTGKERPKKFFLPFCCKILGKGG